MPYPLPLTRTEAYLAYKAGVIQQSDLKPSLAVPRNGIDAWLAYWTGLAADYPKREDGTPHILQEEEAYIAYLCGVINEYPEKCLRRVGAYLRYLISARWGRPDHPLNREELYLSLIKTQFIPSGDPSSDIEIDGTAKAAFVDVKMYGDTFQTTYTGKNLLEIRPSDNSRGLTIVNNARTGELTFSGTTTQGYPWLNESFPDLPAGTYTFSIDKPVSETLFLRLYNEAGGYPVTLQFTAGNISDTKTTDYAIKRTVLLYGETSSGATVAKQTIKPMLEAGSTVTAFEPYVGGIPSPNPDYPQTVQTVTGSQTVTVTGKNIFDGQLEIGGWTINTGQTCTYATNNNAYRCINPIPVKPSSTYSFSVNGARFDGFRAIFCDSNMTVLSSVVVNNTIVTPANCAYITFYSSALKTQFPSLSDIKTSQIEKGADISAYVPYSSNDYEINLGKNLFNQNDVVNGIPSASDGSIISTSGAGRTSGYIPVMANTSYSHTGHSAGWATIAWYKADKSFIQRVDDITTTTSPSGAAYARVSCAQSDLGTCQFEAGEPTSYAAYFTPIELCKLGNYQDYIWKDGDSWKVHKSIGHEKRLVNIAGIDSNASVYGSATTSNGAFVISRTNWGSDYTTTAGIALASTVVGRYQSQNIGSNVSANSMADGTFCQRSETNDRVYFRFASWARVKTVDEVQQMFTKNGGADFWYPLATPTDTTITDTTLIAQLEALVKGGSEDGTTYIKLSTPEPNLPGLLYVEAAKYV